jgi:hypothetical protein
MSPDFVGTIQSGFDEPFYITTDSGESLAEDMTRVISNSLKKNGFKTVPVSISASDSQAKVQGKLKASNCERLIFLTLIEWKSDTYLKTALAYDVSLRVLDQSGENIAIVSIQGMDDLRGSTWDPTTHAIKAIPKAFKHKMEKLLNHPDITSALR